MPMTEKPSSAEKDCEFPAPRIPAPSKNVLMGATALAFLIMHVAAGIRLEHTRAAESHPLQVQMIDPSCD